jgi:hypothetical protein
MKEKFFMGIEGNFVSLVVWDCVTRQSRRKMAKSL